MIMVDEWPSVSEPEQQRRRIKQLENRVIALKTVCEEAIKLANAVNFPHLSEAWEKVLKG